jgi:hypothetical protein
MIGNFRLPTTSGAAAVVPTYTRPIDWLALPSVVSGNQKFVGLHAVYNNDSNFCALQCASNYTVDWGDGVIENFAANVSAYHLYNYAYAGFVGTETARGYRQAIVTITPQATFNLTKIDLSIKHTQTGLSNYSNAWLDVKMAGASISTLSFGSSVKSQILEQFNFVGNNAIAGGDNLFSNCYSLQNIVQFYTASITSGNSMFQNCYSLPTIPVLDFVSLTSSVNMFLSCYSLKTTPALNTPVLNNCASMFNTCYALETVGLINTANVTNASQMFRDCYGLKSSPLFNLIKATSVALMFYNCISLQESPLFNLSVCSDPNNMFGNCQSLKYIPAFNLSVATALYGFVTSCQSLKEIPSMNVNLCTNFSGGFDPMVSLERCQLYNIGTTISFAGSSLSQTALVEIFNNLKTVTGQTINITNNWGAALLTASERLIATNKGWTITG